MIKQLLYFKKITLSSLFSIAVFCCYAQCDNIGFESGTTAGWTCGSGKYGFKGDFDCAQQIQTTTVINFDGNCLNQGGINGTNKPVNARQNRHILVTDSSGMDPNSFGNVSCLAPASMFPGGINNYSFRLGNAVGIDSFPTLDSLALAEAVKFTTTINSSNAGLTYMYALFIGEDPRQAHQDEETPYFTVKITDSNGQPINCGSYEIRPKDYGLQDGASYQIGGNVVLWKYTAWKKITLDLSAYIGQTITIQFITRDCVRRNSNGAGKCIYINGVHSSYAYLDMFCAPVISNTVINCEKKDSITLCAPAGYGYYHWQYNTPKNCLTIKSPSSDKDTIYKVDLFHNSPQCVSSAFITVKGKVDFKTKNASMCSGDGPKQLEVIPTSPGNYNFSWEPKLNLNQYNIENPVFTPGTSTTYTITMSDKTLPKSCDAVKTLDILVGKNVVVKIASSDSATCEGNEVTLNASGASNYIWQPGNLAGDLIKVNPLVTTSYTVTGSDSVNNCPGKAITTVVVRKKTIVEMTDLTIYAGDAAILQGNISGGSTTGIWNGGLGIFTPDRKALNATYKPTSAEENSGSVQLTLISIDSTGLCPTAEKTMKLTILSVISDVLNISQDNLFIEVYPNPFSTVLNINISGLTNASSTELKLFDYLGKEVRSIPLKNGTQKLDRNGLTSGIYFIEVYNNGKILQKKKIVITD